MTDVTRYFKRPPFRGDYQDTEPKWHIYVGEDPGKYGVYVGLCGYERSAILGDLTISRAKQAPARKATCRRCLKMSADPAARSPEPAAQSVHTALVAAGVSETSETREELIDMLARIYAPSAYWNLTAEYPTESRGESEAMVEVARITVEPMVDALLAAGRIK